MKFNKEMLRVYAVTDRRWLRGKTLPEAVEEALKGGATLVQLREKEMDSESLAEEAVQVLAVCRRYGVPLIIDDNVRVCLESGADGVHVGQSDMNVLEARKLLGPERIVGATAHNLSEALQAQEEGADYLGCGAAFGSATKKDAKPINRAQYKVITSSVRIPVCAVGGITKENIKELHGAGLSGVAVVSALFAADDIQEAASELKKLSEGLV